MDFSKESKVYRSFYPIKQWIICKRDVVYDEATSTITLSNSSYSLLSSAPFEIIGNCESIDFFIGASTGWLNPLSDSTYTQPSLVESITSVSMSI